jgi:hypothetical protein
MDDDLSAAERQMIVILREWAGEPGTYRLTIDYTNGRYEIEYSIPNHGGRAARGVGRTLSEAWGNVAPSWA